MALQNNRRPFFCLTLFHFIYQMETPKKGDNYDWFEELYASSGNDIGKIPWTDLNGNTYLKQWITNQDMSVYQNQSVLVVGCGIGGDAELLSTYFSKSTAFDISSSAIKWIKNRFPESKVNYFSADIFDEQAGFQENAPYDFIFEAYTIQALPRELKVPAMEVLPKLLKTGGQLLVICDGRKNEEEGFSVPHPLSPDELQTLNNSLQETSFEELEGHQKREFSKRTYRILFEKK
jgi:SAM-dependent methyltransferase